jgi:hypothetical protein
LSTHPDSHYGRAKTFRLAAIQFSLGLGLSALLFAQNVSQPAENSIVFQRGGEFYTGYMGHKILPRWAGKYYVEVQDIESKAPLFNLTDSAGHNERVVFQLPDTPYIYALGYNVGTDGSIAVIGNAPEGKNSDAEFIAWISPDRKRQTVVQAYPFVPEAVAVAADGTIWSVISGNVIRRYDTSGKLLSSLAVVGLRCPPPDTPGDASRNSRLEASQDRVGWFTSADQYLEFSLDGKEIGRFEGPPGWGSPAIDPNLTHWYHQFALSADNQPVISGRTRDGRTLRIVAFDRNAQVWKPVSLPGENADRVILLGFDGTELVTISADRLDTLVRWTRGASSPEAR